MKKSDYRQRVGKAGEDAAAAFLIQKGFRVLERNYRAYRGELDIIATDGETLVIVEVKTGKEGAFGAPETWVDLRKQKQIGKVALAYLQERNLLDAVCRFDVIGVDLGDPNRIRHIKDAFWLEGL